MREREREKEREKMRGRESKRTAKTERQRLLSEELRVIVQGESWLVELFAWGLD